MACHECMRIGAELRGIERQREELDSLDALAHPTKSQHELADRLRAHIYKRQREIRVWRLKHRPDCKLLRAS